MATVTGGDIARLLPTRPPGVSLGHLHSAAREVWPTLDLPGVAFLLYALVNDGHAVRTDDEQGNYRYHLESR